MNTPSRVGRAAFLLYILCLSLSGAASAQDQPGSDDFQFFQKEATLVTPARRPTTAATAPATTYVVTAEDIRVSGAQTLWDALRGVPGVDVMSERTSQGDVGIRGLNHAMNNNVLVLLDGKTLLNGFFDSVEWEAVPVTMAEIDRIEIVEGPASALYGTNAVSGVINIITKTPEQLKGGVVEYTGGERSTHMGTALIGDKKGAQAYKLDLGWRSTNMFSDASSQASSVGKAHAFYSLDLPHDSKWDVSGGVADQNININNGPSYDVGETGFVRTDFKHGGTSARVFWNWNSTEYRAHPNFGFHLHADTYDAELQQALDLPFSNSMTVGASYRRNDASSDIFDPGWRDQSLWAGFFEDTWRPADKWSVVVSAREDHDSLTGWEFSPRGSVIYEPAAGQSVRLTAASAFDNPPLFDDYVHLVTSIQTPINSPPYTTFALNADILPNPNLQPEKIQFYEAAYRGDFDWIRTGATAFYYRLTNLITSPPAMTTTSLTPPVFAVTTSNALTNDGETKALGGELEADLPLGHGLSSFANYSYQSLIDQLPRQTTARSAPKHKVNAGLKLKQGGWTAGVAAHWVSKTYWSDGTSTNNPVYDEVRAYVLLDLDLLYRFSGKWDGLELAVHGFNVADRHYETLAAQSVAAAGQNAEELLPRWSGTVSYRFGL